MLTTLSQMETEGWFNNTLCLFKKYFKWKDRDGKWAKNPLILVFNYRSQGGPDPEMQLMVKFTVHSFPPSFIPNASIASNAIQIYLLTKGGLVENHRCPGEMV